MLNQTIFSSLLEQDKAAVWHPFTPIYYATDNIIIERGDGAWFYDIDGNPYLDAISSWWVNLHGHCNPYITKAIIHQLGKLEHSIFAAFTHEPGITLATRLLSHLPNFEKVFFSDNGSTAVEVGIKMALQYWWNIDEPKQKIIAFKDAYHGDTFGGMSVAARNAFNQPFEKLLFDVIQIDIPNYQNFETIKLQLLHALKDNDVACFIFEPLVLGAAGMLMYPPHLLNELIGICKEHHCLTIADEVMTGFGRTGKFFAIDHLQHKPDIICLSKGLTGGFFPLGATACKGFIYEAFKSTDKMKTFFHGHSYTGNPVTCAAGLASLDLMELPETMRKIAQIAAAQSNFAHSLAQHPMIENIRTTGTILAMDVKSNETTGYLNSRSETLATFFIKRNIILRPLGNVLYVLPPYCIEPEELQKIHDAIKAFLEP